MDGGLQNIDNVVPVEEKTEIDLSKTVAPEAETAPTETPKNRALLSWEGQSFDYKEKGLWWFLALGLIVTLIIVYLVWQKDWFTIGITVVVTAVLIWYLVTARPRNIGYALTSSGIEIDKKYYDFSEIHSFWIVYTPKVKKLFVALTKKYLPTLTADLTNASPERVRAILSRKVPEQNGRGENVLDQIIRALGL